MSSTSRWNPVTAVAVWSLLGACGSAASGPPATSPDAAGPDGAGPDAAGPDTANAAPTCGSADVDTGPAITRWTVTFPGGATTPPSTTCTTDNGDVTTTIHCRGDATVHKQGATITVVPADGATVRWDDTVVPAAPPPPLAEGATVWMDWTRRTSHGAGGLFSANAEELQLRDGESGPTIWVGVVGYGDLDEATARALFGVPAHVELFCQRRSGESCSAREEIVFDEVLETTPPVTVPHGRRQRVTTALGSYDVVWAHTGSVPLEDALHCPDVGESPLDSLEFAATRVR